jgi:hypothetical protein
MKPEHVDIKLETAFGNGAGCRLEPAEVAQLIEERRRVGNKRVDADRSRIGSAIAFGDGSER